MILKPRAGWIAGLGYCDIHECKRIRFLIKEHDKMIGCIVIKNLAVETYSGIGREKIAAARRIRAVAGNECTRAGVDFDLRIRTDNDIVRPDGNSRIIGYPSV